MAPKPKRTPEEIRRDLDRLLEHYGIALSDDQSLQKVLFYALRDGLVRLPPKRRVSRKRGRPPEWTEREQELFNDIDRVREEKARNKAVETGRPLRSVRRMGIVAAIKLLQTRFPETWGDYGADDLRKRYYNARRVRREDWRSFLGLSDRFKNLSGK
jgi:hypothetical protein